MTETPTEPTRAWHIRLAVSDETERTLAIENERRNIPEPILLLMQWDEAKGVREAATRALLSRVNFEWFPVLNAALARLNDPEDIPIGITEPDPTKSPRWTDYAYRASLASTYTGRHDIWSVLAQDPDPAIRQKVANRTQVDTRIIVRLGFDPDASVREAAISEFRRRDGMMSERAADRATGAPARVVRSIEALGRAKPTTPEAVVQQVAASAVEFELTGIVRQSWFPADALRTLVQKESLPSEVLSLVASHHNAPPDVLSQFASGRWRALHGGEAWANPSMPPELLRWVATGHGSRSDLETAWANPSIPADLLLSAPIDPYAKRGAAANESAPSSLLAELSKEYDRAVLQALAGNPATPSKILIMLATEHHVGHHLMRNCRVPRAVVDILAAKGDEDEALALSEFTPADVLAELTRSSNLNVRLYAVRNPNTPEAVALECLEDKELHEFAPLWPYTRLFWWTERQRAVREARLLPRPNTLAEGVTILIRSLCESDQGSLVRLAQPAQTNLSTAIIAELLVDPVPHVLDELARTGPDSVRWAVLNHARGAEQRVGVIDEMSALASIAKTTEDPELMAAIVRDRRAWLALLMNDATPPEILNSLLDLPEFELQYAVVKHRNVTTSILDRIAESSLDSLAELFSQHPLTSGRTLSHLVRSDLVQVRQRVAAHPSTAARDLLILSKDHDELVRLIVGLNRNAPPSVLSALAGDASARVRQVIAAASRLGDSAWVVLATDPDSTVRALAARYHYPDLGVRTQLGGSNDTSAPVLAILAGDFIPEVRLAVAGNVATAAEVLFLLAKDPEKRVRAAVANNPCAPGAVLDMLISDPIWGVRRAAGKVLRKRSGEGKSAVLG